MKNTLNSSASCFQFHAALTNIQKSEITIIRFGVSVVSAIRPFGFRTQLWFVALWACRVVGQKIGRNSEILALF